MRGKIPSSAAEGAGLQEAWEQMQQGALEVAVPRPSRRDMGNLD